MGEECAELAPSRVDGKLTPFHTIAYGRERVNVRAHSLGARTTLFCASAGERHCCSTGRRSAAANRPPP